MRIKKNGYVLHLEGTWMEISNRYGVLKYGDVAADPEDVPEGYAEKALDDFISRHRVVDSPMYIKRVAYDGKSGKYIQLQAVRESSNDCWTVQKYDDELIYMGEDFCGLRSYPEALAWMRSQYNIVSCLTAQVFRSSFGDCTNGGISSTRAMLYILAESTGGLEPYDIRECVRIERSEVAGKQYIHFRPAYCSKRWYMAGGNFLYTSDCRFEEITGSSYPIPIHDRCEFD